MVSVMWFRRDLRLSDNIALAKAMANSDQLVALFHLNPEQLSEQKTPNQSAFLESLRYFKKELSAYDIPLQVIYGDWELAFEELRQALPEWDQVYFNYDDALFGRLRDQKAAAFFRKHQIIMHTSQDHYLHGASEVLTQSGALYKVFTPYYNNWKCLPKPTPVPTPTHTVDWLCLDMAIDLETFCQTRIAPLPDYQPGSQKALALLKRFVDEGLSAYKDQRDYPALEATSKLSPYLRHGNISIRQVYHAVSKAPDSTGKATFIKELAWRDFYHMIAVNHPDQKNTAIQSVFTNIEWDNNKAHFECWKSGQTGFPIVDAAMRQLAQTGWMHNRLRMIVASFLTKDLLIDWRWGERYFQEALIDYDPASNIGGWQWAASTGTDAAPYFRIFNPTTQGKTYDPEGKFISCFVPELAHLPMKYRFQPELLPESLAQDLSFTLGKDYPKPIVDHAERRKTALARYEFAKENHANHQS